MAARTTVVICVLWLLLAGCRERLLQPAAELARPQRRQLITVVTGDWDDFRARLQRYERAPGRPWQPVGPPIAAVVGRAGFGWGRGLHGEGAPAGRPGPYKREGDNRSPAGMFELGAAYGYDPKREELALPYVPAGPQLRCVDDPASHHYNRIVVASVEDQDWNSAERMRRDDALYELAIVVRHNPARQPGAGSCIFLHVWSDPDTPVTGCTAMEKADLERVARWLRRGALVVALPRGEYTALKSRWKLP